MKLIALSGRSTGLSVAVSDEDFDFLNQWKWQRNSRGYARRTAKCAGRPDRTELMHRVVGARMGLPGEIDHKNRDRLDCQRSNLRRATRSGNNANTGLKASNTSGLKGVRCERRTKRAKWTARITVDRKEIHLGTFATAAEAAAAYDRAAEHYFGEYALLNGV